VSLVTTITCLIVISGYVLIFLVLFRFKTLVMLYFAPLVDRSFTELLR
jgi:hypothetical protein